MVPDVSLMAFGGNLSLDIDTDPCHCVSADAGMAFNGSTGGTSLWPQVAGQATRVRLLLSTFSPVCLHNAQMPHHGGLASGCLLLTCAAWQRACITFLLS